MMSGMSDRKTQPNDTSVEEVIDRADSERRRDDARAVLDLMQEVTGTEPVVWGPSMIGFGRQPYTTADGKEHEWFAVGLAPRKAALTLYGLTFYGSNEDLLERLGPHTTGKGCVYVKRVGDLDHEVLPALVALAWQDKHQPGGRRADDRSARGQVSCGARVMSAASRATTSSWRAWSRSRTSDGS